MHFNYVKKTSLFDTIVLWIVMKIFRIFLQSLFYRVAIIMFINCSKNTSYNNNAEERFSKSTLLRINFIQIKFSDLEDRNNAVAICMVTVEPKWKYYIEYKNIEYLKELSKMIIIFKIFILIWMLLLYKWLFTFYENNENTECNFIQMNSFYFFCVAQNINYAIKKLIW